MVRYARIAISGGFLLFASYAGLLIVMPALTPFTLVHCVYQTPGNAPRSECYTGINPDYPVVFIFSIAGTVMLLFGVFGRAYVTSPLFVAGMIALEYGLAGVVSSAQQRTGVGESPLLFAPLLAVGGFVIVLHTIRYVRRSTVTRAPAAVYGP